MKLHKPLFSIVIILIQLILTLVSYFQYNNWYDSLASPELFCGFWDGGNLFMLVFIIAFYEMRTKHKQFKVIIQVLLIFIVFVQILPSAIRRDLYAVTFNTAMFSAFIALILFAFDFLKYLFQKLMKPR